MQQRWLRAVVMSGALAALGLAAAMPALAQDGVAWLGVYTQTLDSDLRSGLDYDGDGVLVSGVVDDGPADRAGVRKGDIIVSFNSRGVETSGDLTRLVRESRPGQEVSLVVWREGDRRTLSPRLVTRPSGDDTPRPRIVRDRDDEDGEDEGDDEWAVPVPPRAPAAPRAPKAPKEPRVWVFEDDDGNRHEMDLRGLDKLRDLEHLPGMRGTTWNFGRPRLGITMEDGSGSGVRVGSVLDGTPADRAGLREGDVIVRIGGTEIDDSEDVSRVVRSAPEGPIAIEVRRNGTRRTLEADLGPKRDEPLLKRRIERDLRDGREPRTFEFRTPTPGAREELRWKSRDRDELRREIENLRRELQRLERELEEREDDR